MKLLQILFAAVVCGCACGIVAAQEKVCSLEFSIPEGWAVLSDSAELRAIERALGTVSVAATRTSPRGVDTYVALVLRESLYIDEDSLDALARRAQSEVAGSALTKLIQQTIFEIDGVRSGKFILGAPNVWGPRAVVYYVPGGSCTGVIVCNTNGSALREMITELDAAVMSTTGVRAPPEPGFLSKLFMSGSRTKMFYGAVVFVGMVAALEWILKRRRS